VTPPLTRTLQGNWELKQPIYVVASRASKSAIEAIEQAGGKVVCKYYNSLALRDCIKGRDDRLSAAPTRREDIGASLSTDGRTGTEHRLQSGTAWPAIVVSCPAPSSTPSKICPSWKNDGASLPHNLRADSEKKTHSLRPSRRHRGMPLYQPTPYT
jgi:Ribosomal proteins 50S-L15, 50S-L18e, 60S-L27A